MAYDEKLATRVRGQLAQQPGWSEQRMFGGLGLLRDGHLAVAVTGQGGLMVRHDPADGLDEQAHTAPVVMRDREMTGWLVVEADGITDDAELARWIAVGAARVRALHPDA